ncbi:hypothetical protein HYV73_04980 [Candidatus Uhrbacteria bacterium]|nr:hypothetical protein [Candidatus Uhrbacteria bacterium]
MDIVSCTTVLEAKEAISHRNAGKRSGNLLIVNGNVEWFIRALKALAFLIGDWDGTFSPEIHWNRVKRGFSPEAKRADKESLEYIRGARKDFFGAREGHWWVQKGSRHDQLVTEAAITAMSVHWMKEAGVKRSAFEAAGRSLALRDGVPEFFAYFEEVCVVSWGLADVLVPCLRHHGLHRKVSVAASEIRFAGGQDGGKIIDLDFRTVVVGANKDDAAERFIEKTSGDLSQYLIIGDSLWDLLMMAVGRRDGSEGRSVNLLIHPPSDAKNETRFLTDDTIDRMWPTLSGIYMSASFAPLTRLIRDTRNT